MKKIEEVRRQRRRISTFFFLFSLPAKWWVYKICVSHSWKQEAARLRLIISIFPSFHKTPPCQERHKHRERVSRRKDSGAGGDGKDQHLFIYLQRKSSSWGGVNFCPALSALGDIGREVCFPTWKPDGLMVTPAHPVTGSPFWLHDKARPGTLPGDKRDAVATRLPQHGGSPVG